MQIKMSTEEEVAKLVRTYGENWQTNKHYLKRNKEVMHLEDGTEEEVDDTKQLKPKGVEGVDYKIREEEE